MNKHHTSCRACKVPLSTNEKGVFCFGRGHGVFESWEYLNSPIFYNHGEKQPEKNKELTLF